MALTLQSMRVGVFGWRGEEEEEKGGGGGGGGVVWVWEKERGQTRPNALLLVQDQEVEEKSVWRRGRQGQWWMTAIFAFGFFLNLKGFVQ